MKKQFKISNYVLQIIKPTVLLVIGFLLGVVWFRFLVLLTYPKPLGEINPGANIIRIDAITDSQIIGNITSKIPTRLFLGKEIIIPDLEGNFTISNNTFFSKEILTSNCKFVASKSGKVYYPSDHWRALRINSENILCFTEEKQATDLGLRRGK